MAESCIHSNDPWPKGTFGVFHDQRDSVLNGILIVLVAGNVGWSYLAGQILFGKMNDAVDIEFIRHGR